MKLILLFMCFCLTVAAQTEQQSQPLTAKKYARLMMVSDIDLIGMEWSDLGLQKVSSFSNPMIASWVKWLVPNTQEQVGEVLPCTDACSDAFYTWLQIPQESGMEIAKEYVNSLWMRVSYKLRKVHFEPNINEWTFDWEGSVVLLDANSKLTLATKTIEKETKTWRGLGQKELNSALASAMYKSALDHLNKASLALKESDRPDRLTKVTVRGQKNLTDVFLLIELLKKEGESLRLSAKLDMFGPKEAQILCFYKGEEKSFSDLLSRLKELKSSKSYGLVNESSDLHHVLKLVAP